MNIIELVIYVLFAAGSLVSYNHLEMKKTGEGKKLAFIALGAQVLPWLAFGMEEEPAKIIIRVLVMFVVMCGVFLVAGRLKGSDNETDEQSQE
jgi:uncharacterized membrane protein